MQEQYPHEMRRFSDGETLPDGWLPLSDAQFRELDSKTPEERGAWLEANGKKGHSDELLKHFAKDLPPEEDIGSKIERGIDRSLRGQRRQPAPNKKPQAQPRQHREQGRGGNLGR